MGVAIRRSRSRRARPAALWLPHLSCAAPCLQGLHRHLPESAVAAAARCGAAGAAGIPDPRTGETACLGAAATQRERALRLPPPTVRPTERVEPAWLQGARTVVLAAFASGDVDAAPPALYWHDRRGCRPAAAALDRQAARDLWSYSTAAVGLTDLEDAACWPGS